MRIVKKMMIPLLIMVLVAVIMLIGLSVLTYIYKWQADKALMGITITYIVAGFIGGMGQRRLSDTKDMSKKLLEGIFLGLIFIGLLVVVSLLVTDHGWKFSSRFLMIWMLITGSACLGRIL